MPPLVGGSFKPALGLSVRVGIVQESTTVKETLAHISDRSFYFTFSRRPIRAAGTRTKIPMRGETQKLGVQYQSPFTQPVIANDDGAHLCEQQLLRHTAKGVERTLQSREQSLHGLTRIKSQPQQPRKPLKSMKYLSQAPGT